MPDAQFRIRLTPRASKNEVTGLHNGTICLRVTAPPVDGAANAAVTQLLADCLSVGRGRVEIVSGLKSREKTVRVSGLSIDEVFQRLGLK